MRITEQIRLDKLPPQEKLNSDIEPPILHILFLIICRSVLAQFHFEFFFSKR